MPALSESRGPAESGHYPREALLKWFIVLFVLDVAVRRVDIDREKWGKWLAKLKRRLGFGDAERATAAQESLGSLLATKEHGRGQKTAAGSGAPMAAQASAASSSRSRRRRRQQRAARQDVAQREVPPPPKRRTKLRSRPARRAGCWRRSERRRGRSRPNMPTRLHNNSSL